MLGLFLILVGIVLRANEQWFNGAETVGTVSLIAGGCLCALEILVFLFVFVFGFLRR